MSTSDEIGPLVTMQTTLLHLTSYKKANKGGRIFAAIFFAIMVLSLLALLFMGVNAYRAAHDSRIESNDMRLGLSLIGNSVRMNDSFQAVGAGEGPEGRSLVLTEMLSGKEFETRIYAYQGKIVQEYSAASVAYTPEKAREIVASNIFDFEYSGGLLTVHTDQGAIRVALRSSLGSGA